MKIKNLHRTSDNYPPTGYDSWIDYLKKNSLFQIPTECPVCGSKEPLIGAHVQKFNSADKSWYIVPICEKCNHREQPFDIDEFYLKHAVTSS